MAPRFLWKETEMAQQSLGRATRKNVNLNLGSIITLKVTMFGAVGDASKETRMTNVCNSGHEISRIRQKYVCPICGAESGFKKAHENDGLHLIDEATQAAASEADMAFYSSIDLTIHPLAQVSTQVQPNGKSYYLDIENGGAKLYTWLVQLVKANPELAFMARFTIKSAVSTYRLVIAGDSTLMLQQQADPDLIRVTPMIDAGVVSDAELLIGNQIVQALVEPFDPALIVRGRAKVLAAATEGKDGFFPAAIEGGDSDSGMSDLSGFLTAALAKLAPAEQPAPAPRKRAARKPAATKVA
jgi:hypothetical protein